MGDLISLRDALIQTRRGERTLTGRLQFVEVADGEWLECVFTGESVTEWRERIVGDRDAIEVLARARLGGDVHMDDDRIGGYLVLTFSRVPVCDICDGRVHEDAWPSGCGVPALLGLVAVVIGAVAGVVCTLIVVASIVALVVTLNREVTEMCERTVVFTQGSGESNPHWDRCVMEGGRVIEGSECVFESSTPCSRVLSYAFARQAEATLGGPVESTTENVEGQTQFTFRPRTD